jgi:hypothetical protein
MTPRECLTCSKPLSAVNRTGYCRKHYGAANNGPRTAEQNRRQWADPAIRVRLVESIRRYNRARVSWCPLEYRDEYHRLKRVKHCSAAEARRLIEEMIAADTARYARTGQLQQTRRAA